MIENIVSNGLSILLSNRYAERNEATKFMIENINEFPEYVSIISNNEDIQLELIDFIYEQNVARFDKSIFSKLNIQEIFKTLEENPSLFLCWGRGDSLKRLKACALLGEFSWNKILDKAVSYVAKTRYFDRSALSVVFKAAAQHNKDAFISLGDNHIFSKKKLHHDIRASYYTGLISSGLLNEKYARLIRSEASEYASQSAVETLFNNASIYSNADNLFLLFSDTKHASVAVAMAQQVPEHLLSSLLGTEFGRAKHILEKRMQNSQTENNTNMC